MIRCKLYEHWNSYLTYHNNIPKCWLNKRLSDTNFLVTFFCAQTRKKNLLKYSKVWRKVHWSVMMKHDLHLCRERKWFERAAWNTWPRVIKWIANVMVHRSIWCRLRRFEIEWVRFFKRRFGLTLRLTIVIVVVFPSLLPTIDSTGRWIDIKVIYILFVIYVRLWSVKLFGTTEIVGTVLKGWFLVGCEVIGRFGCWSV